MTILAVLLLACFLPPQDEFTKPIKQSEPETVRIPYGK